MMLSLLCILQEHPALIILVLVHGSQYSVSQFEPQIITHTSYCECVCVCLAEVSACGLIGSRILMFCRHLCPDFSLTLTQWQHNCPPPPRFFSSSSLILWLSANISCLISWIPPLTLFLTDRPAIYKPELVREGFAQCISCSFLFRAVGDRSTYCSTAEIW